MKPDQEHVEDQLLDALLHEHKRSDREQALAGIETAIDGVKVPIHINKGPVWPKRLGIIAASIAMGGLGVLWFNGSRKDLPEMAMLDSSVSREQELAELKSAIGELEDKVEERRKVLTTISRTKDISYSGNDGAKSDALERNLDAQDYADAKRDYESDLAQLEQLKHEKTGTKYAETDRLLAVNEPRQEADATEMLRAIPVEGVSRPRIVPPTSSAQAPTSERNPRLGVAEHLDEDREASYVLSQYNELEGEKIQLEAQIDSLLKYDSEQLVIYASGLNLPDNAVRSLYPRYLELKRQVDGLKASGLGDSHPTIISNERMLNTMKDEIDEEIANLRKRLQGSLMMANERLAKTKLMIDRETTENSERYGRLIDPIWQRPTESPLSTFSIDVDTASYANIRRFINEGRNIPADAVRIEECINAFKYSYEPPVGDKAFAVHTELATCPWNENNLLVKFGIKGREIAREKRPVSNLVFLIDVSGSMQSSNKLPLVKESLKLLLHQLDERDSVSYVVYAGSEGVVLPPTKMTESGRVQALEALDKLEAGGSTNGGAGINRAYQIAAENFIDGGVNRVILASDGDFNVGVTGNDQLVKLVKERAAKNIYLSALAFGTGNLNDAMFEAISNDGNGNYFYIDGIRESRKVFLENLTGSLITIAKDVKIQVEFNPAKVGSYRLIGYANRVLKDEDFNNDTVDAGDIGAGHTVTAFYEIVPAGAPQPNGGGVDALKYQDAKPQMEAPASASDEWLTLKLRHKHPEGDISALQETFVKGRATPWQESGSDFRFATAVAMFGMKLRGMEDVSAISWEGVRQLARPGLESGNEDRAEFVELISELEKRSP